MKNIVIGVASAIVLVLLLFCIYTLQGDATRKTESSDSITQAMENAAAKMTAVSYTHLTLPTTSHSIIKLPVEMERMLRRPGPFW